MNLGDLKPDWQSACGNYVLFCGDCLEILPKLPDGCVDAVVTDPPYSSGGMVRGDRMASTRDKYQNSDVIKVLPSFTGDNRDQRSFLCWCSMWLMHARSACVNGAVVCVFCDWRQLPTMTDAVQCAGWIWRNLATWWKPGMRMQRGRFSSSAEYVVYGTNGPHNATTESSPQNVIRCETIPTVDRDHQSEKPLTVVEWAMSVSRAQSTILDPFMGSGTTGVACVKLGRKFIGIELDRAYFEIARKRIEQAILDHNGGPMFAGVKDDPKLFDGGTK